MIPDCSRNDFPTYVYHGLRMIQHSHSFSQFVRKRIYKITSRRSFEQVINTVKGSIDGSYSGEQRISKAPIQKGLS